MRWWVDTATAAHTSPICCASSRVGVTTSMSGPWPPFACPRPSSAGSENAAVLPVPVLAAAMRSRPSSTSGMACSCTGVGIFIAQTRHGVEDFRGQPQLVEFCHRYRLRSFRWSRARRRAGRVSACAQASRPVEAQEMLPSLRVVGALGVRGQLQRGAQRRRRAASGWRRKLPLINIGPDALRVLLDVAQRVRQLAGRGHVHGRAERGEHPHVDLLLAVGAARAGSWAPARTGIP